MPVVTLNAEWDFPDLLDDIRTVGISDGTATVCDELVTPWICRPGRRRGARPAGDLLFEVYYPPLTTVYPNTFLFDLLEQAGYDPSRQSTNDHPQCRWTTWSPTGRRSTS